MKRILALIKRNEQHHRKLYFVLFLVLSALLFLPIFFQIRYHSLRSLGLIGLFFINAIGSATLFLPTPGLISVSISATQSNPLLVALIGALGSSLGESTTFLFGFTSRKVFNLEKHKWIIKFRKKVFNRYGSLVILGFSFLPNPLFDGIGIIAGISKYPVRKFIILTFIGRLLKYIVIAHISSYIAFR